MMMMASKTWSKQRQEHDHNRDMYINHEHLVMVSSVRVRMRHRSDHCGLYHCRGELWSPYSVVLGADTVALFGMT